MEDIRVFAGLDSLGYLSIDSLKHAIDIPENELCLACFNGKYPVPIDETFSKYFMESA